MLMSLGTSIAYFSSIAVLAINATQPADMMKMHCTETFFDSVVFLVMFLMIGRLLEAYSKAKAGDAVGLLGKLRPTEAVLITHSHEGQEETTSTVPFHQLELAIWFKSLMAPPRHMMERSLPEPRALMKPA